MEQRINPLSRNQGRQTSSASRQRTGGPQASSPQMAQRKIGQASSPGVVRSASALHVGDIVKGEITDLSNNRIAITLEDNTVIRGQIADSTSFSIGQTGAFRLTDISNTTICLEAIPSKYSETEATLIYKALEEANLPNTIRNQEAVKALMDNLLPINKASIMKLMQQSYDYQTMDMNTLAVMNRLMMKMDADTVTWFSNYRNDNYELLTMLTEYAKEIPALLSTLSENGPADVVARFGQMLLSIDSNQNGTGEAFAPNLSALPKEVSQDILQLLSHADIPKEVLSRIKNQTLSLHDTMQLLYQCAKEGTLTMLPNVSARDLTLQIQKLLLTIEPADSSAETFTSQDFFAPATEESSALQENLSTDTESEKKPTANMQDILPLEDKGEDTATKGRLAFAGKFLQAITKTAGNTLTNTLQALQFSDKDTATNPDMVPNHSLDSITKLYENFSYSQDLLNQYLSPAERKSFVESLREFPISPTLLGKITSGEATTSEVLTVIRNAIPLTDSTIVKELFHSPAFEKVFARSLLNSWTITPEQLKEGSLSNFYENMKLEMEQFQRLIQSTLSGEDSKQLSNAAQDIQKNVSFMHTLDQAFSYFQLPLKLPSENAHGDLYVYTNKKKLKQQAEKASVVLHLKMEHLGCVDVRIEKDHEQIRTKFTLEDKDAIPLFETNTDMLKDALEEQGFTCQITIDKNQNELFSLDEFINTKVNTHATTEMKRFSFDIRA